MAQDTSNSWNFLLLLGIQNNIDVTLKMVVKLTNFEDAVNNSKIYTFNILNNGNSS